MLSDVKRWMAAVLVHRVVRFAATAEERRRARAALLAMLADDPDFSRAKELLDVVLRLAATAEDKREAREALTALLTNQTNDSEVAEVLMGGVAQLAPAVGDLSNWRAWAALPTIELLTAVRRNSSFADWLAALDQSALGGLGRP
jgi:hypothetical protein